MAENATLQEQMMEQIRTRELFEQAKSHAYDYLGGLAHRSVFPTDEAIEALKVFDEPMPASPGNPREILRLLHQYGSPATTAQAGGRYFGFVNGSSVPAGLAAKWLSDVWDQNTALHLMSPIASQLEATCEKWLLELLGLPAGTAAGFVSGTSTATMCGLAAGRDALLQGVGWNASSDGLFGAPRIRVVLGEQAHASVFKALGLLGLGRAQVESVPADDQGRMIPAKVPKLDSRCIVILQAGDVNTGAFDPFDEICDEARLADAWVHIDGAFGLWAAASRAKRSLTRGIAKANSWSVDAHKTINSPYDCGVVLCRRPEALASAMRATGSYIQYSEKRDGMHYTPEMSRRARAVELWATLKSLGKDGVEGLVDRLCGHAERFAETLLTEGFRILNDVVFNQVLVACDTPELTRATLANIQKSGECWCGGAVWHGEPVIRISVCSWVTTTADVERSVAAFLKARDLTKS